MVGATLVTVAGFTWLFVLPTQLRGYAENPHTGIMPVHYSAGTLRCWLGADSNRRVPGAAPHSNNSRPSASRQANLVTQARDLRCGSNDPERDYWNTAHVSGGGAHGAARRIPEAIKSFYATSYPALSQSRTADIEQAADTVLAVYNRNVLPELKVSWGTYPNNLGHTDFSGCFRCHDGEHNSSDQNTITQDCVGHETVSVSEASQEILKTLGLADRIAAIQKRSKRTRSMKENKSMKRFSWTIMVSILVPGLAMAAGDAAAGKVAYDKACKSCHGADGTPNAAIAKSMKVEMKALGSAEAQAASDDDLKKAITAGQGKMKPIKSVSGKAADDVVAYMRTLKK